MSGCRSQQTPKKTHNCGTRISRPPPSFPPPVIDCTWHIPLFVAGSGLDFKFVTLSALIHSAKHLAVVANMKNAISQLILEGIHCCYRVLPTRVCLYSLNQLLMSTSNAGRGVNDRMSSGYELFRYWESAREHCSRWQLIQVCPMLLVSRLFTPVEKRSTPSPARAPTPSASPVPIRRACAVPEKTYMISLHERILLRCMHVSAVVILEVEYSNLRRPKLGEFRRIITHLHPSNARGHKVKVDRFARTMDDCKRN